MADDGNSTLPFSGRIDSVAGSAANVLASTLPIAAPPASQMPLAFSENRLLGLVSSVALAKTLRPVADLGGTCVMRPAGCCAAALGSRSWPRVAPAIVKACPYVATYPSTPTFAPKSARHVSILRDL